MVTTGNYINYDKLTLDINQIILDANLQYNFSWNIRPCIFPNQPAEYYYGCREYKRHIIDETTYPANVNKDAARRKFINKKATQMLFRLNEGDGRALYIIGVEDNGHAIGIHQTEVLTTLVNFICMTGIIKGCVIHTFNIYKTSCSRFVCTLRIKLNSHNIDTSAVLP